MGADNSRWWYCVCDVCMWMYDWICSVYSCRSKIWIQEKIPCGDNEVHLILYYNTFIQENIVQAILPAVPMGFLWFLSTSQRQANKTNAPIYFLVLFLLHRVMGSLDTITHTHTFTHYREFGDANQPLWTMRGNWSTWRKFYCLFYYIIISIVTRCKADALHNLETHNNKD